MKYKKTQYDLLKSLVQQKQGEIHADILLLSEEEQVHLFKEALEEGTILAATVVHDEEDDLEKRIQFVKQVASLVI